MSHFTFRPYREIRRLREELRAGRYREQALNKIFGKDQKRLQEKDKIIVRLENEIARLS